MKKKRGTPEQTKLAAALRERKEAIEQQAATADVLKIISRSMADVQPVFDALAERTAKLFGAVHSSLFLAHGNVLRRVAVWGPRPGREIALELPILKAIVNGRAYLERRTVHVPDLVPLLDSEYPDMRENQRKIGFRSMLSAPLVRNGEAIGVLGVWRRDVRPFTLQEIDLLETFAAQAVIAIENARLFNETKEALERQTATAEILKVISSSPTEVQPVLDAVTRRAAQLCGSLDARIFFVDGPVVRYAAGFGEMGGTRDEVPLTRGTTLGRAIIDRQVVHVEDLQLLTATEFPDARVVQERYGHRTTLAVPLLREGESIGVILLRRREVRPFSEKQIELVRTFADQAVIAIENVRLFNETKEALERQTATSEILKVIASSPSDVQPVFEAIVGSCQRLFGGRAVTLVLPKDNLLHSAAFADDGTAIDSTSGFLQPWPCDRESVAGTSILESRVVAVPDTEACGDQFPKMKNLALALGYRAVVCVPLLRDGKALGAIGILRATPGEFADKEIALAKTFADQAVIAIENVRLFNETKEALEQQTATAEILDVISSSPTDTQPVFEAIAHSALRVFDITHVAVLLVDGDILHIRATAGTVDPRGEMRIPLDRNSSGGRAILDRAVVNIPDSEAPGAPSFARDSGRVVGFRAIAAAPMVREGVGIGSISIMRKQPGAFTPTQMDLLKTFADQAVIAIENVRLFNETKESLERQTATSEILRVISSSTTDTQPVFDAIVRSAAQLFAMSNATIFMRDGDLIRLQAIEGASVDDTMRRELGSIYPIAFDPEVSTSARAIAERRLNVCLDTEAPDVAEHIRRAGRAGRFRSNTVVPLVRDDEGIGTIVITHPEPGYRLNEKQLALLQTFADQAVIAIENVRLFKELEARNKDLGELLERQTATAEILRVIAGSPSDVQPVFDAVAKNAAQLCGASNALVWQLDGDALRLATIYWSNQEVRNIDRQSLRMNVGDRILLGARAVVARAVSERRVIHLPDIAAASDDEYGDTKARAVAQGFRALLCVPLMREGEAVGVIFIRRTQAAPFSDEHIELLRTFADQAAIAIENVRLFKEIQEKSAQLEIANQHKSEFLANMSHELRTPLNAIIGFSEVLMEKMFGEVNEKQADYLKDIHESGKHLLSLINDILDLSKIEAGRMELDLGSFDLPGAISNAMTLVRERAQRHGVALASEIDPRLGPFNADERKVKQILLNLLSNAVKFTPEGGRVDVSAKLDTDKVEIAVRDTGVGISPEDQARLFEEFRQVGKDSARKAEGTGLGLALTKKFVELHGGAIRVDSAPGKGSTFSFSLPLAAAGRSASSG